MSAREITVAVSAYASDPDFTAAKAGRFTLMHLGAPGDSLLYASFDGLTDSMILRPDTPSAVQITGGISYKKVWLRSSGSTIVLAGATLFTAGVQAGDELIITHGSGATPINGTYTVDRVLSQTSLTSQATSSPRSRAARRSRTRASSTSRRSAE